MMSGQPEAGGHQQHIRELQKRVADLESENKSLRQNEKRYRAEKELRRAKQGLEDRVVERTAELQKSEERFRTFFRTNPDIVVISRLRDGLLVEVNQSFSELSGWSRKEAIGRTSISLGLWPSATDRQRMIDSLDQHGTLKNLEVAIQPRSGSRLNVLLSGSIIDIHNEPHLLTVARDITDWKKTREEVRMLATVVEQTGEGVGVADLEGNILFINRAFETTLHAAGYLPKFTS